MFLRFQKYPIFAALKNGFVAEWLGRALQKLVQQFESARNLKHLEQKGLPHVILLIFL